MNLLMSKYSERSDLHIEILYDFDKTGKDGKFKPVSLQRQGNYDVVFQHIYKKPSRKTNGNNY